jgi:Holliday junction DNA helicase RuvA
MIAGIRGRLEGKTADSVLITVGGVTLRVFVPVTTLAQLGGVGAEVALQTYLYVREDTLALYGFATEEDRALFEQLIGISGIGPRAALEVLSVMSAASFREAIAREDVTALTRVPGIGKKLAARLVLELRGKLVPAQPASTGLAPAQAEVVEALTGLGYTPGEAQAAAASLPSDGDAPLEQRIMQALRYFAQSR